MMKILVMDQEEQMADLLSFYFRPHGIQCVLKTTALEAIDYLETNKVDFIVLETELLEMGDSTFLHHIHKKWNIPFLIVSRKNSREEILKGFKSGADDYISKPFDYEELTERVSGILRRRCLISRVPPGFLM
ncbi:response regulator transcription factor [Mesobacillus subterraneus]|uniref:Response regulator n=1 Tax=Mesobacillus subterraneus TaxID=285983 RepID=A0A427TLE1_9BACI|nr:response regulator [Mesobacillus subterraneus]RSD25163.1 response regulator [Mesobacillus subterraneus]